MAKIKKAVPAFSAEIFAEKITDSKYIANELLPILELFIDLCKKGNYVFKKGMILVVNGMIVGRNKNGED